MKQEQKELLLKDLCGRLPYGVKVQTTYINPQTKERKDIGTDVLSTVEISMLIDGYEEHKPYLFPLSSMTAEQRKEYDKIIYHSVELHCERYYDVIDVDSCDELHDFYHKNHFDYRGLIPMDLANDATGLNIY